jgi:hypothetical protein
MYFKAADTSSAPQYAASALYVVKSMVDVDIVFMNDYSSISTQPAHGTNFGRKWIIATFAPPVQSNCDWNAVLTGIDNADARIKYQRGEAGESEIGWLGASQNLEFVNGELNATVRLNDGTNATPKMNLAGNILTISSVQQGDKIIIEDPASGARDEVFVVKNFSWNDLQRLGTQNLSMASEFDGLSNTIKEAIISTAIFCLDPSSNRLQRQQWTNDCFPDSGLTSINYTNLLQLDIPSARSIGLHPDDYEHWHMGMEVATLPADITNKQAELNIAVGLGGTFPEFQSNTVCKLVDLLNTTYSKMNTSFVLLHTYEGGEAQTINYQDSASTKVLKCGDTVRNIRYPCSLTNVSLLSYPSDDDNAFMVWERDEICGPKDVRQVSIFVNRCGRIVLIAIQDNTGTFYGMVSDAVWEE